MLEKVAFYETQVKQSEVIIKTKEDEKRKEIDIVKDFFKKKIDEGKSSDNTVSIEKQK